MKQRPSFFYRNGLSVALLGLMFACLIGQVYFGWNEHNHELSDHGQCPLSMARYLISGHFISATFENWESEFLQMAMDVVLTISLRQRGSSESKKLKDEPGAGQEEVDRIPKPHAGAPWPVKMGGLWLRLYQNSLAIAFTLLFVLSFLLHLKGSRIDYNEEQALSGKPSLDLWEYLSESRFWFESFQNWQSEFLAVASIVLLSIWLRQHGSPESKPVDEPHHSTGG